MKNILLGNTGISVSRLGAGVLPMGPNQRNMAVEEGAAVVRHALDAGINFIDTAQYYRAYPYIRQALAGRNDDVVICSKSLAPIMRAWRQPLRKPAGVWTEMSLKFFCSTK